VTANELVVRGSSRCYVSGVTDHISATDFHASEGAEDWRVLSDNAQAFYRTASFAESARFVAALGGIDGVGEHPPDVDVRHDGVTVSLITSTDDYRGMSRRDVEIARRISGVARDLGLTADPTAVQSLLIIPGAPDIAEIVPFWRAVLGYEPRPDGGGAIHVGVWVPVGQAKARVAAALAAGGRLVRDDFAPAWWTLADAAGNEADIGTVEGRD